MEMNDFEKYYDNTDFIENNKKIKSKPTYDCCLNKINYLNNNGSVQCKICSNIISNISNNPEWRYYGSNDTKTSDPTRCGMPVNTLLPESSVGSSISYSNNNKNMHKIRQYQQWNGMPYKERSLYKVFSYITEICKKHNISQKIINDSKSLYKICSSTKISRGLNRQGIIAATVYFACKECGAPRSSKEIAEIFDINITTMTKGSKKFQEIIFMNKNELDKERIINQKTIIPTDFINRFCNKLDIDKYIPIIHNICDISMNYQIISENTPPSIASGCIYYFSKRKNLKIPKKRISEICKISEVTINKCSKKLELHNHLFDECFN